MSALATWGEELQRWAIPQRIIERAPESPFGFDAGLFRRRAERAETRRDTPTTRRALAALPEDGTVLDVGCGAGATSLPLAGRAGRIVGVDAQRDMLEAFAEAASGAGVRSLGLVAGAWPGVAEETAPADVVVCGHVLYNVPDLAPFAHALDDHARRRVVIEITETHPLAWMNDLWQRLHDLHRPDGPTAADAERALRELGLDLVREEQHERRDLGGFRRSEDAVAFVRRRLCLPASRDPELIEALGRRLRRRNGSWTAGPSEEKVVTLWWDRTDSRTRSALEPDVSA